MVVRGINTLVAIRATNASKQKEINMDTNNVDVKALIDAVSQASTRSQESDQKHTLELSRQANDAFFQFLDKVLQNAGPLMELYYAKKAEQREHQAKLAREAAEAERNHEIRMQELKMKTAEVAAGKGKQPEPVRPLNI
jgi:hypothetical protein